MEPEAFAARVAQPLLLQAPLQAVLLDLFGQLQAQGSTITTLQQSLGAAEAREREGLDAARQSAADAQAALRGLEARVAAQELAWQQEHAGTDARLRRLELRLHGASNLAGRQAALDDIASMLGVNVPEVQAPAAPQPVAAATSDNAIAAQALHPDLADSFERLHGGSATSATAAQDAGVAPAPSQALSPAQQGTASVEQAAASGQGSALGLLPAASMVKADGAPVHGTAPSAMQPTAGAAVSHGATPLAPQAEASRPGSRQKGASAPVQGSGSRAASAAGQRTGSAASARAEDAELDKVDGLTAAQAGHTGEASGRRSASSASPSQPAQGQRAGSRAGAAAGADVGLATPVAAVPQDSVPDKCAVSASRQPAGSCKSSSEGPELLVAADNEHAPTTARPKNASCRLAEVVNLLRKRPTLERTGLLWKLQASLAESVEEQERLKGEVASLQERLAAVQAACGQGLERCNQRIDGVEELVAAVSESSSEGAPSVHTARGLTPRVAVVEFQALEERVGSLGSQVQSCAAQVTTLGGQLGSSGQQLTQLDGRVQSGEQRLCRVEERLEAQAQAAKLLRASSGGGGSEDVLSSLQGHLLAQQQRLAAQMEGLAAGIKQALPGQVHDAVTGAVVEVGRGLERRLSEKLATRQDLQTLSVKVGSKVSREEVEKMLRAHRAAHHAAAEPGSGPAAGMRFKCLSCDSDMQPFVFAAPPGALPFPHQQHGGGTADLRYSQLPVASPPRHASQPWTDATAPMAGSPGGAGPEASRLSSMGASAGAGTAGSAAQLPTGQVQLPTHAAQPLSARPSTAASRLGAPVSWMHRMRRETGGTASQEGSTPVTRRESMQEQQLQHQPLLTAVGIACPQSAFPLAAGSSGGLGSAGASGGATPRAAQRVPEQQASGPMGQHRRDGESSSTDFYEAIREEPPAPTAAFSGTAVNAPQQGEEKAEAASGQRSRTSLTGAAGKAASAVLPALGSSQGRIKAVRPATAAVGAALMEGDADAVQRSSGGGSSPAGKRRSTGMAGA